MVVGTFAVTLGPGGFVLEPSPNFRDRFPPPPNDGAAHILTGFTDQHPSGIGTGALGSATPAGMRSAVVSLVKVELLCLVGSRAIP